MRLAQTCAGPGVGLGVVVGVIVGVLDGVGVSVTVGVRELVGVAVAVAVAVGLGVCVAVGVKVVVGEGVADKETTVGLGSEAGAQAASITRLPRRLQKSKIRIACDSLWNNRYSRNIPRLCDASKSSLSPLLLCTPAPLLRGDHTLRTGY